MPESPLANNWQGLRADVAPHLLDASESPETYDAAIYGDRVGIIGPRRGRRIVTAKATNVLGLGGLNVPWGRYRITATDGAGTDNATWSGDTATWPSPTAGITQGYDLITFGAMTAQGVAVNTPVYSTAKTFTSLTLSNYSLMIVKLTATSSMSSASSGGVVSGTGKLQISPDGVTWTTIATLTVVSGLTTTMVHATPALSGAAAQLRVATEITADTGAGGTLDATFTGTVYLMYGTAGTTYPAA